MRFQQFVQIPLNLLTQQIINLRLVLTERNNLILMQEAFDLTLIHSG